MDEGEPTRPPEVPDDWLLVICQGGCDDMVWVPPDLPDNVVKVCSSACAAKVMVERARARG